ncbi:putative VHS domain, ENTH domain, AP-4 complex accessory subunit Tepsin [Helianthus annuus]|uniref:Putative ENTH/VHS family protein n=1 Tax=Helianthus annuus TaxID=4232 RepID=A0A251SEY7_HELAN|nr:protein MODIFIED TRANSPORT TO THE VACUOLE 1 [Helianthus annuus]KAF5768106.1 putative VHS domain, ENTH domain, AP-4 complex accessory subunit Tepsin [Helianthus annuus]KAJ0463441.1 putative VHS domain, ENTH domain, tepsin, ENTH/VHS domain, AP-4 complex accessory subunit Tepsin [Helianthus annuus]KAJ0484906.1 putative VHS domain, ENTH domain, tepsin, ENTH/VHS domain, AP-4 complex accessory subunit Tepsin [Helianthus annuus]KAJ0655456.1 putative VHS domain, ENTH domain, tepsin, ENTH/VHS domain,
MDSSRRAVESYWRSVMIDAATSDEDKVTPVYKLEEICELLRSSHVSVVKEICEFVFKRLQHKSPIVKQKALRVIKYAVGKSGVEFRREMQRNSVAVRQLVHYKGQPDPLKGDALNKSVRETAQEALTAIFAGEDNSKPPQTEGLARRIEGFGNTNYNMPPSEDKKSFLSEVVGIGSATIKLGLNSIAQAQTPKNDTGTYRSPNLRRSLTNETSYNDNNRLSTNASGPWSQDNKISQTYNDNGNASSSYSQEKSREERLLETIVTSGGVRLQPTRDAIQVFLSEATKLNALALSRALEVKLQSHMWQVRVKALCVLEALLRKKEDEHFSTVTSYFTENIDVVVKCSESPQASLREKANKVLSLLDGDQSGSRISQPDKSSKTEKTVVHMPDLIDTNDSDENANFITTQTDENIASLSTPTATFSNDFFMDGSSSTSDVHGETKTSDDPFADVAFHGQNSTDEHETADIFSGMATQAPAGGSGPELFDIFGSNSENTQGQGNLKNDLNDLMAGLSVDGNESLQKPNGNSQVMFSDSITTSSHQSNDVLNNILKSQAPGNGIGVNNPMFSMDPMTYNALSSGLMFNPATFTSQQMNYGAMSSILAQQQFLATMSNLQQMGNLQSHNMGATNASGTQVGGYDSALPDIFNPTTATQPPSSMMNNSKKEDTRAFDFISDHLAAARDPRRVNQ